MEQTIFKSGQKLGISLGLAILLAGCAGSGVNPISGGEVDSELAAEVAGELAENFDIEGQTEEEIDEAIPEEVAGNLNTVDFSPENETLVISIGGLDTGTDESAYTRDASLDVPGFVAFTKQDDPLDRFFLALAAKAPDGSSQAFAVGDGGQFNIFFAGTRFERLGEYTQPTSGLVSYAGEYAATTNIGQLDTAQLLVVPAGAPESGLPRQPIRVTGDVLINVDFADLQINGVIFDRVLINDQGQEVTFADSDDPVLLVDATLVATDILEDGTFEGIVEEANERDPQGTYAGTFGGTNASSVAIGVHLDQFQDIIENEEEFGAAALARCGTVGDAPLCAGLGE